MNERRDQIVNLLMAQSMTYYRNNGLLYHNEHHIKQMLLTYKSHFSQYVAEMYVDKPNAHEKAFAMTDMICLAIAYHDAVYATDLNVVNSLNTRMNEDMSALLFYRDYVQATTFEERGLIDYQYVMDLIQATWWENHINEKYNPTDAIKGVILDCDLVSLADDWEIFVGTQRSIIREKIGILNEVTDEHMKMSANFLRKFLQRTFIYHTPVGREKWEARARENILKFVDMHQ